MSRVPETIRLAACSFRPDYEPPLCTTCEHKEVFSRPHSEPPTQPRPSQEPDLQPFSTPCISPPVLTDDRSPLLEEGNGQPPSRNLSCAPSDEDEWEDEDSDGEDDDLDNGSESSHPGWEPPISTTDIDAMSVSSDNVDSGPSPSYVPPEELRERTWVAPKVTKFPSPHAGKPLRSVDPANDIYATRLGNHSESNPYRPFASKIDWEVAKWAKLRGPSSTSLADLLKIEGVTLFYPDG